MNNPEDISDLETPESNVPEIATACEWLNPEEDKIPAGILQIVAGCLKDIKKLKTNCSINMVTQLIAVTEYVKLHKRF